MDEHVSWKMIEKWVGEYSRSQACEGAEVGELRIEVNSGMIGLKNPKTGLVQIINPNDFKIGKLSADARIIVCETGDGDYFVYVLNPGSDKVVLLELILEKEAFGVYSQDYLLGFKLSGEYCASAVGKNLLLVDFKRNRYVFIDELGEKVHAKVKADLGTVCTVVNREIAAICTPGILYVIRKGKRVGIELSEAIGEGIKEPLFGVGKSEKHTWLALKDGEIAVLVSLTDKDMGYTVIGNSENELKGKRLMD